MRSPILTIKRSEYVLGRYILRIDENKILDKTKKQESFLADPVTV